MFCFLFPTQRHAARRRFAIAGPLGLLAGLVCVTFASQTNPDVLSLTSPLFWTMISDRVLLGLVVGMAGAFTVHPIFGFRFHAWLRGIGVGAFVSLPIAFGALTNVAALPAGVTPMVVFVATIIAGAVYGLIIDVFATKWGGEGRDIIA